MARSRQRQDLVGSTGSYTADKEIPVGCEGFDLGRGERDHSVCGAHVDRTARGGICCSVGVLVDRYVGLLEIGGREESGIRIELGETVSSGHPKITVEVFGDGAGDIGGESVPLVQMRKPEFVNGPVRRSDGDTSAFGGNPYPVPAVLKE